MSNIVEQEQAKEKRTELRNLLILETIVGVIMLVALLLLLAQRLKQNDTIQTLTKRVETKTLEVDQMQKNIKAMDELFVQKDELFGQKILQVFDTGARLGYSCKLWNGTEEDLRNIVRAYAQNQPQVVHQWFSERGAYATNNITTGSTNTP